MLPLPNNSDERGQERRPSLPSIRDLFPEHLLQPVKRPSPFSFYDLGSSLPSASKSSSGSPAASESPFTATSAFSSHSEWSHTSGSPTPVNRRSASSDMTRHFMTAPHNDDYITLPPIQMHPPPSSRRASVPFLHPPPTSGSRSRSRSEGLITKHLHHEVPAEARRRHSISSRSYRGSVSAAHSRRPSLTNPYSARTGSPPSSYPSSPPSTASGDDAPVYERKKTPARYQCEYCGRCFNRPSSLKIHHNTHTGEKPFACLFPGCGRHFSVMSNMRRHARTHVSQDSPADHNLFDSSSATSSVQSTPIIPPTALPVSPQPTPSTLPYARSEASLFAYPRSYSRSRSRSPLSDSSAEP